MGQLEHLAEDNNLLAVVVSHLPLRDRLAVSRACSGLCQQVRAVMAVKLALQGEDGEAAAAAPPSRAFTGAMHITYRAGAFRSHHRAMASLLRYAADTWAYVTSVTLELEACPELSGNPVALVGPLNSLALMPHLVQLSLYAPRLEGLEAEALAALTGLSRLELTGAYNGAVYGAPLPLPQPWALSGLVGLKELSLDNIIMHGIPPTPVARLPTTLTALTILSSGCVDGWLPALTLCVGLQQLEVEVGDHPEWVNVWGFMRGLAPHLVHLTSLTFVCDAEVDGTNHWDGGSREAPQPCFPALRTITCPGRILDLARNRQWRLLGACSALEALNLPLVAQVAPPPDMGQLGLLTRLELALSEGWAQAGALLRYTPLVEEVVITALEANLPNALPLALVPLTHLQRVQITADVACPDLVEVVGRSLSTTRSLTLDVPLGAYGWLPDLSLYRQLTRLVWTTQPPTAGAGAGMAAAAAAAGGATIVRWTEPEELLWSLRGCGGLVELSLTRWTWLDARLALAAAGAHPLLRLLKLEGCGVLPGSFKGSAEERLQRIRGLLRPSLVLEVVC